MMKEQEGAPEEELENNISFEPDGELGDVGAAQAKIKKLKDELATVKIERQEYLDGWQRCKADSVNTRKEAIAHGERIASRSKETFVEEIIPALDGFDMASGSTAWESLDPQWREGIDQIRNQLLEVLSRNGVDRYGKVGDVFNNSLHEAIEERDDLPGAPGTIGRILRYGYKFGVRIIRPAHVITKK